MQSRTNFFYFYSITLRFFDFFMGDKTTRFGCFCFDTELLWGYMVLEKGFVRAMEEFFTDLFLSLLYRIFRTIVFALYF